MPRLTRRRSSSKRINCEERPEDCVCCNSRKSLLASAQDSVTGLVFGKEIVTDKQSFYDCVDRDMDGNEVRMDSFRGDVCVVINVASKWGLAKANYVQLSKLHDEYSSRGLRILAFPCNQFAKQEPGTHAEILDFVEKKFRARDKFAWFAKGHVNGKRTREVFSFLKARLPASDGSTDVRWNFSKFLVDHEGVPIERYSPKTSPGDMAADIEDLLKMRETAAL